MAREKLCIYCNKVMLEGFDDIERKYYEKGSKTLHTRERCEAAKGSGGENTGGSSGKRLDPYTNYQAEFQTINAKLDQILNFLHGQGTLDTNNESPSQ